jgi:hypothetical protein
MNKNLVSFKLTDEEFTALKQKLIEVDAKVNEFALELHISDKHTIQAMGLHSMPFTDYAYMMASQRKDLVPSYLDMDEFAKDMNLFKQSRELLQMVEIIRERLIDTSAAAGADAFTSARKFYTEVKGAIKSGIPGATVIYDEMKKRFLKMKIKNAPPNEAKPQVEIKETVTEASEKEPQMNGPQV